MSVLPGTPTGTRNGNVDSSAANESSNVDCPQSKFVYEDISFTKFFDDATDVGGAGTITDKTITAGAIVITYTKGDGSQSTYTAYGYFMGSEQVTIEKDQEEVAGVVLTYHISNKQSDGTVTTPVTAAVA